MSIFPFIDVEQDEKDTVTELPVLKEYAYDFQENKLLLDENGKTFLVEKNEALRIWIFKALSTARSRYTAYSPDFGTEIEDNIIGKPIAEDIAVSEIQRYITEALMVNPYIQELSDFNFSRKESGMEVTFCCQSIYGKEDINFRI